MSNKLASRRDELLAAFSKSMQLFLLTAESYPRPLLRRKPTRKKFSACEIVYHMLQVEQLWQTRIRGLMAGSMKSFKQIDPLKESRLHYYNSKPYDRAMRLLAKARGHRNRAALPPLSEERILAWADTHQRNRGHWPSTVG